MTFDFKKYLMAPSVPADDIPSHSCFCTGPQDSDPVCPCMMRRRHERYFSAEVVDFLRRREKPRFRIKAGSAPA